jgi:hypothetical protein
VSEPRVTLSARRLLAAGALLVAMPRRHRGWRWRGPLLIIGLNVLAWGLLAWLIGAC